MGPAHVHRLHQAVHELHVFHMVGTWRHAQVKGHLLTVPKVIQLARQASFFFLATFTGYYNPLKYTTFKNFPPAFMNGLK